MSKVSFIHHYGERTELSEARTEYPNRFEVVSEAEVTDSMYEDVFCGAQFRLGLGDLGPTYEEGRKQLIAPEGFMFLLTGAFTLWPDGNDIDWGYGPPADSVGQQQRLLQEEIEKLVEKSGISAEEARAIILDEDQTDDYPAYVDRGLDCFFGKSITMSYAGVEWGRLVNPDKIASNPYVDEGQPIVVEICVQGFKKTWFEQAARSIKLPNSSTDKLLSTYEYGMPGIIPCYESEYCKGNLDNISVELVPIQDGMGEVQLPTLKQLWVPESVRYYLDARYPGLIDMGSDYKTRTDFGATMRLIGSLACGFGGREGNVIDEIAQQSSTKNNLVVIDNPVIAQMDIDKLAATYEEYIVSQNEQDNSSQAAREREREEKIRKGIRDKKKQLIVVTGVDEPLDELVERVGNDDSWLEEHVRHVTF